MTIDMLMGGLMILLMVAGIVVVMTTARTGEDMFNRDDARRGRKFRSSSRKHQSKPQQD
ncbi:MAG: hypothetical protein WBG95_01775 [Sulfitobacter sp.]